MEQKNADFFDHVYNFFSSNFNLLGKIRQRKKNPLKLNFLNFRKMGNLWSVMFLILAELVFPSLIYNRISSFAFSAFATDSLKTVELMHFFLSFFTYYF